MKYDAIYFLKKFYAIPDKRWTTRTYIDTNGRRCAMGHCGKTFVKSTNESRSLNNLLIYLAAEINDGNSYFGYDQLGDTPKERVMNALLLVNAGVQL